METALHTIQDGRLWKFKRHFHQFFSRKPSLLICLPPPGSGQNKNKRDKTKQIINASSNNSLHYDDFC